jgi:hypothetical protein
MLRSTKSVLLTSLTAVLAATSILSGVGERAATASQAEQRTFTETGKTVKGRFLEYWNGNGGLPQQGFPISEEMQERSDTDGKTYTVQYFERAVFEMHPENPRPNDVLLSLLGVFLYEEKYPGGAPGQQPNTEVGSRLFTETGKRVGGLFLEYWQKNGGLAQQGFPISDEFMERNDLDGKTYRVQYFQRAVFEYHPENQPPYNVLLSQLGTFRYRARHLQPSPTATTAAPTPAPATPAPPVAEPTPTQPPATGTQPIPQTPDYAAVRARFENMTTEQWRAAGYTSGSTCEQSVGIRVTNPALWDTQYNSGQMDPEKPTQIIVNGSPPRVIGLVWHTKLETQQPVLFGQQVPVRGIGGQQLYMLNSYFKPNGYVLFTLFDPAVTCR